jgi:hypothetical protein
MIVLDIFARTILLIGLVYGVISVIKDMRGE